MAPQKWTRTMNKINNMACYACLGIGAAILSACNPQQAIPPADTPAMSDTGASASAANTRTSIVNWGQRSTPAGVPFNVQADGNSGVSFELSQPAPPGEFTVLFDGKPMTGVVVNGVIMTATIPNDYIAREGTFPVTIDNPAGGLHLSAGDFTVMDAARKN